MVWSTYWNAGKAARMAPPMTKARDGFQEEEETSRKAATFVGLVIPGHRDMIYHEKFARNKSALFLYHG
jgi:hypothetical protein